MLSESFQKQIFEKATGGTVKGIKGSVLHKINLTFPSLPEQTKIANFLTAIDEKITQLTQKCDLLAQYKKGVMQQIFSQQIRFKDDGREFPEWEIRTLDEVCNSLDNKRKPLNSIDRANIQGEIPYYGANGIVDYINDYIFDEDIVLLAEDGGNFEEFSDRPIAQNVKGKSWVNNHAHVLSVKSGHLVHDFLFFSLVHRDIRQFINGSSRAKLNKSDMLMIEIPVPSLPEQTKIANFLTAIDDKITHTQAQLAALKQYKQGLLQQMFV